MKNKLLYILIKIKRFIFLIYMKIKNKYMRYKCNKIKNNYGFNCNDLNEIDFELWEEVGNYEKYFKNKI